MKLKLDSIKRILLGIMGIFVFLIAPSTVVFAEGYGVSMSPLNQTIILNPGEKYTGSFTITNPIDNLSEYKYRILIQPFFVDENYSIYYEETEGLNQIVNWTTTDITSGTLPVGASQQINFTINVPEDAPAGGQYEAITVASDDRADESNIEEDAVGASINQNIAMAQIIYAEIAGTTRRSGDVIDINLPNFVFDGNITAESTIKNTGNTHGTATYILQVFPLFSNEEIYTNEENPKKVPILPNRTFTNKSTWDQTPMFGIFNVKYTVEFEGVTTEVNKLVIKCPLWLLFVILFVTIALIIWIVIRIRTHKKSGKRAEVEA